MSRSRSRDRKKSSRERSSRSRDRKSRKRSSSRKRSRSDRRDRSRDRKRSRSRDRRRRRRSSSDSRSRSRDRRRRRRSRSRSDSSKHEHRARYANVDPEEIGTYRSGGATFQVPQPGATNIPSGPGAMNKSQLQLGWNKQHREVWIGNLLVGAVNSINLADMLTKLFRALPEFQQKYHALSGENQSAVREVKMQQGASFAFVEFWSEELAATAMEFNGADFMGRPLKTGKPSNSAGIPEGTYPLDVSPLREAGILPAVAVPVHQPGVGGVPSRQKARELYFGNLPQGQLTSEAMKALVTPASELLPQYNPALGPAVISVHMNAEGMYCFVEFQSEELATAAMPIFDKMDVIGRSINVNRPTGYTAPGMPGMIMPPQPAAPPAIQTGAFSETQQALIAAAMANQQKQNNAGASPPPPMGEPSNGSANGISV